MANFCLQWERTFLFCGFFAVFRGFSFALIYCHMIPTLTIDLPVTKCCGQSGFYLTFGPLQRISSRPLLPDGFSTVHSAVRFHPVSPITLLAGLHWEMSLSQHSQIWVTLGCSLFQASLLWDLQILPLSPLLCKCQGSPHRAPILIIQSLLIWLWMSSCQEDLGLSQKPLAQVNDQMVGSFS